jgi:signal transduction histidine kinase
MTMRSLRSRLRPHTVRLRLTALYGVLFLACGASLLAITYVLVEHGTRGNVFTYSRSGTDALVGLGTAPKQSISPDHTVQGSDPAGTPVVDPGKEAAGIKALAQRQHADMLNQLLTDSGIALGLMALLSCGLGWVVAGRTLRPLETSLLAQRQFVANASHELRTPLARQRAIGQVALADPEADAASLRVAHERVLAAGSQQERLITGLLALARGQAGVDHTESLDLAEVAARVLAGRQLEAELRGLVVDADLDDAPVSADPRLVESLVGNLVDNALRHNVPDGRVAVSTRHRDGRALLSVSNSGPVIPLDAVPRLLEPFRRLGADRRIAGDGFGIGLSIVRAVCAAHRATLTITPRDGGGLTVDVAFTAMRPGPAASGRVTTRPARPSLL